MSNQLTIQKARVLRKRYAVSRAFDSLDDWFDLSKELQKSILENSHYQLVEEKSTIEWNIDSKQFRVFLEVIGPKIEGTEVWDFPPKDIFRCDLSKNLYQWSSAELLERTNEIFKGLQGKNGQFSSPFSSCVHLVIWAEKLELHFFNQKDYIHS